VIDILPETLPAITEALFVRAANAPDAFAFAAGHERVTWRELLDDALRVAGTLEARGLTAGAHCALVLPTGLSFVRALFGTQLLGAVPVAINPRLPAPQIARRVRDLACACVIVSDESSARTLDSGRETAVITSADLGRGRALSRSSLPPADPDTLSHLQLTSGTTGEPRAAMLRHRQLIASLVAARELIEPRPRDLLVGWLPLHHDFGLVRFVFAPVFFGCRCHLVGASMATIPTWLQTIARTGATITGAPDSAFRLATRLVPRGRVDLRSLRIATSGGEPVRVSTIAAFESHFDVPGVVRPGYGLAEATLGVTALRPGEPLRTDGSGAPSCGRPLPGFTLRIVDDAGIDLPAGAQGEILVSGPAVFAGYWNDPAGTAEVLRHGRLHTGDLGALDEDGHLYVHGRLRAMIKRGGAAIAPREIEEAVDEIPSVRRSAAVGVGTSDHAATEHVIIVAEIERRVGDEERAALRRSIHDRVLETAGFAPHDVRLVAPGTIPRTGSGKVRYQELRKWIESAALVDLDVRG
jgi:fatty-acyl-CoA synthase